MKRFFTYIILLFVLTLSVKAQQMPTYTQFTMNKFIINPAATGVDGFTTLSLVAREDMVGFKGTPRTHTFTVDSRILGNSYILKKLSIRRKGPQKTRSGNTSWGAYFFSDLNGPIDQIGINGSYGYHIKLGQSQLSFGLSLLFFQLKIHGEEFVPSQENIPDPILTGGKQTIWITDANFGAFYTSRDYYVGYSTIHVFNSVAQFGDKGQGKYRLGRQHTLMGGYKFDLGSDVILEPSALLKVPEVGITQFDLNVKCSFLRDYWAGISYRTKSTMGIFGGVKFDRYYIGYSFDYKIGDKLPNTYGSHEIIISARFGDSARRFKWLNSY
jgi:type IX secretion system PorP/SprF family membrane protein